nr:hypothetical protein Iba_chr15cCG8820 [Ipomoea batatas]
MRCPNDPTLTEKLNNPRKRVRSKRQQLVENTTEPPVEHIVEHIAENDF